MNQDPLVARTVELLTEARQNRPLLVKAAINSLDYLLAEYTSPQDKYLYKYGYHKQDEYLFDKVPMFKSVMALLQFMSMEELSEVFCDSHYDSAQMLQLLKKSHEYEFDFQVPGIATPTLLLWAACNIVCEGIETRSTKLANFFIHYCDVVDYEVTMTGCENDISPYHYFYKLPQMWEMECVDTSRMNRDEKRKLHELHGTHPMRADYEEERYIELCAVRTGDPFEIFVSFAIRSDDVVANGGDDNEQANAI